MTETDNVRQFIHELESAKEDVDAAAAYRLVLGGLVLAILRGE